MFQTSDGERETEIIRMPRSVNKTDLRAMSIECASVTDVEISLYGGIPSLLRVAKSQKEVKPNRKLYQVYSILRKDRRFQIDIKVIPNRNEI